MIRSIWTRIRFGTIRIGVSVYCDAHCESLGISFFYMVTNSGEVESPFVLFA